MSDKALGLAIQGRTEKDREVWEQTRIISYYSIAPHLKSNKSINNILPFSWDSDNQPKGIKENKFQELVKRAGK